jgi:hypothetical protein
LAIADFASPVRALAGKPLLQCAITLCQKFISGQEASLGYSRASAYD